MEFSLDTSTAVCGVAVSRQGKTLAGRAWRTDLNHTKQVFTAIESVMHEAGATMPGLKAIIVAIGPGSFSGLRVGVSAAKGLAAALNLPLVGVNTMAVEAAPHAAAGLPICVILDAGRNEIAIAAYTAVAGDVRERGPAAILTTDSLCDAIRERTLFCGEHLPAVQARLAERLGPLAVFPQDPGAMRQPRYLALLGWRKLAAGEVSDPATLQPLYLRAPSITAPKPSAKA
jgi:tRNA threonylcarbamoyladenosine biosynthesis protein TsaB